MPLTEEQQAEIVAATNDVADTMKAENDAKISGDPGVGEAGDLDPDNQAAGDEHDDAGAGEEEQVEDQGQGEGEEEGAGGEGSEEDGAGKAGEGTGDQEVELSDELVATAVRAGVPISLALKAGSNEELQETISSIVGTFVEEEVEEEEQEVDILEGFPEFDGEEYNPEVSTAFNKMKEIIKAQNEQMKQLRELQEQAAQEAQQATQAANVRDATAWFDKQVEGLGEDYEEVLGAGGFHDQEPGSAQQQKRDAIAKHIAVMSQGHIAMGNEPPPHEDMFDAAVKIVLGEDIEKINKAKLSKKLASRSKQHINRAGGKKHPTSSDPVADTVELLNEKFGK